MHPIRFVFLLSTLAACATTPAPPALLTPTPPPPPAPYACRYSLNPWYVPEGALRLGQAGPLFARVTKGGSGKAGAELTLPYGDATQGARLTFTSMWVTVHADLLPQKPIALRLMKSVAFTPIVTAGRGAPVQWVGSTGPLLRLRLTRPDDLPGEPWTIDQPCPDTTLGYVPLTFEKDAVDVSKQPDLVLPKGTALSLAETPGGPTLETLRDDEDDRWLRVLEERDGFVKLRLRAGAAHVDGWSVRSSLTEPPKSDLLGGVVGGLGGGGLGTGEGRGTPEYARCAEQAPFSVRIQGKTQAIGTLWKNAAWVEGAHEEGVVAFRLPELDWMVLEPGATFVMSERAADACRGAPAK